MSARSLTIALGLAALAALARPAVAACPADSVAVGSLCVDKYEASVWRIPPAKEVLIASVKGGLITTAAQMIAGGAGRRGENSDDYDPGCPDTAEQCFKFYAVSLPGVKPSRYLTWFQAAAACRNAGKRLLTNAEWQMAALGTPDPGTDNGTTDCNIVPTIDPTPTGARTGCVSDAGTYDMVGNEVEWVAEWTETASGCDTWFNDDVVCLSGSGSGGHHGSGILRGGSYESFGDAGVYSLYSAPPDVDAPEVGFRCTR